LVGGQNFDQKGAMVVDGECIVVVGEFETIVIRFVKKERK
jgi:hypothetical protein